MYGLHSIARNCADRPQATWHEAAVSVAVFARYVKRFAVCVGMPAHRVKAKIADNAHERVGFVQPNARDFWRRCAMAQKTNRLAGRTRDEKNRGAVPENSLPSNANHEFIVRPTSRDVFQSAHSNLASISNDIR
jgi:hypothetical protein